MDPSHTTARVALALAVIGSGLMAGFFFAYQWSVLLGLDRVDDVTYVETFRAINDTIRNAYFGVAFFGTLPALVVALFLNRGRHPRAALLAGAALLYLIALGITFFGNIPLNDELAAYDEITPAIAATAREDFEGPWNDLNLLRTLAAIGALALAAAATLAPMRPGGQPDRDVAERPGS